MADLIASGSRLVIQGPCVVRGTDEHGEPVHLVVGTADTLRLKLQSFRDPYLSVVTRELEAAEVARDEAVHRAWELQARLDALLDAMNGTEP